MIPGLPGISCLILLAKTRPCCACSVHSYLLFFFFSGYIFTVQTKQLSAYTISITNIDMHDTQWPHSATALKIVLQRIHNVNNAHACSVALMLPFASRSATVHNIYKLWGYECCKSSSQKLYRYSPNILSTCSVTVNWLTRRRSWAADIYAYIMSIIVRLSVCFIPDCVTCLI